MPKRKIQSMELSLVKCTVCSSLITIHRRKAKLKEASHIKHMFCFNCEQVTAFIENW